MYAEDLEALEVMVRAMEAKLREIRACIQREKEAIPKARSDRDRLDSALRAPAWRRSLLLAPNRCTPAEAFTSPCTIKPPL